MKGAICFRAVIIVGMMITLGACADGWSTSQVSPQAAAAGRAPTPVDQIQIMEGDVTDRPYKSLGDVSVTVNKTTLFNADPTREMVNEAADTGSQARRRRSHPGSLRHGRHFCAELGFARRQGPSDCL